MSNSAGKLFNSACKGREGTAIAYLQNVKDSSAAVAQMC